MAATSSDQLPLPEDLGTMSSGPAQPVMYPFPVAVIAGKSCAFRSRWYSKFPWVEYSVAADLAFCFACRNFPVSQKYLEQRSPLCSKGYRNWKSFATNATKHEKCDVFHQASMGLWNAYLNNAEWQEHMSVNARSSTASIATAIGDDEIVSQSFQCEICPDFKPKTSSELTEHCVSLPHHIKLDKKRKETDQKIIHKCDICPFECDTLIAYSSHFDSTAHIQNLELFRQSMKRSCFPIDSLTGLVIPPNFNPCSKSSSRRKPLLPTPPLFSSWQGTQEFTASPNTSSWIPKPCSLSASEKKNMCARSGKMSRPIAWKEREITQTAGIFEAVDPINVANLKPRVTAGRRNLSSKMRSLARMNKHLLKPDHSEASASQAKAPDSSGPGPGPTDSVPVNVDKNKSTGATIGEPNLDQSPNSTTCALPQDSQKTRTVILKRKVLAKKLMPKSKLPRLEIPKLPKQVAPNPSQARAREIQNRFLGFRTSGSHDNQFGPTDQLIAEEVESLASPEFLKAAGLNFVSANKPHPSGSSVNAVCVSLSSDDECDVQPTKRKNKQSEETLHLKRVKIVLERLPQVNCGTTNVSSKAIPLTQAAACSPPSLISAQKQMKDEIGAVETNSVETLPTSAESSIHNASACGGVPVKQEVTGDDEGPATSQPDLQAQTSELVVNQFAPPVMNDPEMARQLLWTVCRDESVEDDWIKRLEEEIEYCKEAMRCRVEALEEHKQRKIALAEQRRSLVLSQCEFSAPVAVNSAQASISSQPINDLNRTSECSVQSTSDNAASSDPFLQTQGQPRLTYLGSISSVPSVLH